MKTAVLLVTATLALAPAVGSALSTPGAGARPLFVEGPALPPGRSIDRGVLRERAVSLEPSDIPDAERLRLNLFADFDRIAVRQRLDRDPSGAVTWIGQLDGEPLSGVLLTIDHGRVFGSILLPGNSGYRIVPRKDGLHSIRQVDARQIGGCAVDGGNLTILEDAPLAAPESRSPVDPDVAPDDGSQIDVLVLFTPQANAASADIVGEITAEIAAANVVYANSNIPLTLRLVGTSMTIGGDSGNSTTDLLRIQNPTDGYDDQIHALRDSKCADLVVLVTETGSACGVAFVNTTPSPAFQAYGFSAVERGCFGGGIVVTHELGHNMAGRHDWAVDGTDFGPYTYNHGYVCPCNTWHDVMAYGNACGGCGPIPYLSNPAVSYGGVPTGVPEGTFHAADMKKTIDNTRVVISNFRASAVCRILAADSPSQTLSDAPDGNADSVADPGETVTMTVSLHDADSFGYTGISGILTTSTPGITIWDGNATWANLAAGATAASLANHFTFSVASSVPCSTLVTFQLALTADQGKATLSFPVTVGCTAWCNDPIFAGASSAADVDICADSGVRISWSPAVFGAGPLGYEVRRYTDAGCTADETSLASSTFTTSYVDTVSPNASDRWYKVFASNDCGRVSNGGACTGPAKDTVSTFTGSAWVSPAAVILGTPTTFNSSVSGGTLPYTYVWDFTNDGTTDATTASAVFTYPASNVYTWRFKVNDAAGCSIQVTGQIPVNLPAFSTCNRDVSNATPVDETPRLDQGKVVWQQQVSGQNYEVYYWDGLTTRRLTNNTITDRNVSISNGKIAWESFDQSAPFGTTNEIYYWSGGVTTRLTNDLNLDQNPTMDNGQVVWEHSFTNSPPTPAGIGFFNGTTVTFLDTTGYAHGGTSLNNGQVSWSRPAGSYQQVFFWNGTSIRQITPGTTPYNKGSTSLRNGKLAWLQQTSLGGPYQVFYWDGQTPIVPQQLTTSAGDKAALRLTGSTLAFWMEFDVPGNDWEIYRWDGSPGGSGITRLTNNSTNDGMAGPNGVFSNFSFDADGDTAVWAYWDGNDGEIYYWDGTSVRALTNNSVSDTEPEIRNRQITWKELVAGNSYDIFYWQEQRFDVTNLKFAAGSETDLSWDPAPCASPASYRLIRGNVLDLAVAGGVVDLGDVTCLVSGTPNAYYSPVAGDPPTTDPWFYVVKENAATDYGMSSSYQPGNPTSGDCSEGP